MATAIGSYATATALKAMLNKSDATDDTIIGLICDRVNQYIESATERVLAPIASTTYLYDGDGSNRVFLPLPVDKTPMGGIRAATLVEVASATGGTLATIAATDYVLRGRVGVTGPYEWLLLTDNAASYRTWPVGYANIRVTGTAGWTAIPDDITELALVIAQRAWNAREVGMQDVVGLDEQGRPAVQRFLSGRDKETLRRYSQWWIL